MEKPVPMVPPKRRSVFCNPDLIAKRQFAATQEQKVHEQAVLPAGGEGKHAHSSSSSSSPPSAPPLPQERVPDGEENDPDNQIEHMPKITPQESSVRRPEEQTVEEPEPRQRGEVVQVPGTILPKNPIVQQTIQSETIQQIANVPAPTVIDDVPLPMARDELVLLAKASRDRHKRRAEKLEGMRQIILERNARCPEGHLLVARLDLPKCVRCTRCRCKPADEESAACPPCRVAFCKGCASTLREGPPADQDGRTALLTGSLGGAA